MVDVSNVLQDKILRHFEGLIPIGIQIRLIRFACYLPSSNRPVTTRRFFIRAGITRTTQVSRQASRQAGSQAGRQAGKLARRPPILLLVRPSPTPAHDVLSRRSCLENIKFSKVLFRTSSPLVNCHILNYFSHDNPLLIVGIRLCIVFRCLAFPFPGAHTSKVRKSGIESLG